MANDGHDQNGISRRDFTARLGAAAAGLAVGGESPRGRVSARPRQGRVLGANDRVVVASIGIRGQGNSVKRGFAQLTNVKVKTLCDIDANLAPERINDKALAKVARLQAGIRPGHAARFRRQGSRRGHRRDAEPLARAGHDLGAAGRQARLRREAGVAHGVGRPQDGRGAGALRQDRPGRHDEPQPPGRAHGHQVHAGRRHRQGLHGARPVLQAAALDRQVSRWPDGARREVRPHGRLDDRTCPRTTRSTCRRSTTTSGSARRRSGRSTATGSTTTGTGSGSTATATPATRARTSSTSRAGASASRSIRSRSARWAATSAPSRSRKRRTCRRRSSSTPTARSSSSARAASTRTTKAASGSATSSTARRAGSGSTKPAAGGSRYMGPLGREEREGPRRRRAARGRRRAGRPHDDGVPALSELHRRDPRQRSEEADVRHHGRAPLVDPSPPREHLVSRRPRRWCSTASPSGSSTTRRPTRC